MPLYNFPRLKLIKCASPMKCRTGGCYVSIDSDLCNIWQGVRSGLHLLAMRDKSINIWQGVRSGIILAAMRFRKSFISAFFGQMKFLNLILYCILKWWGFCTVLWFTVPCTLLSPHFSQWMVAMTEKSEKLTSQKLRGRCFWPLKNWEVRSSNLSVSERLAAPSS